MRVVLDRKKAEFVIANIIHREWKTFLALVFLGNEHGEGESTMKDLATASGLTILSVSQAIPRLVELDMIEFDWIVHMGTGARFSFAVNKKWLKD